MKMQESHSSDGKDAGSAAPALLQKKLMGKISGVLFKKGMISLEEKRSFDKMVQEHSR